jgi:hypothetical protein
MKKLTLLIVVFVVVVTVGLVYFTYTKPAPNAANLLPESTLLFVDVPNFPLARAQFTSTEAYALLQEPEVREFLAVPRAVLANVLEFGRSNGTQAVSGGQLVLRALQGETFVAVTRLSATQPDQPHLVFGADVKRKRFEAKAVLDRLKGRLKASSPGASVASKKYLGVRFTQWHLSDGHQFCHALLDSLLVITTDEDDMRDVIARFTGQAPPDSVSLASNAHFQNALQQMPAGHASFAYLNVERLLGPVGSLLALAPQGAGMFQRVARIQAAASSMSFVRDTVRDLSLVAHSRADKPPAVPLQRKTLALASPETAFYSVRSADWAGAYAEGMNTLAHLGNATVSSGAAHFDQEVRDKGVRIGEDLLQRIGPETATIATWRKSAQWPNVAIIAEFQGSPESHRALDVALGALKDVTVGNDQIAPWEEISYRDETLRTVRLAGSPFAPTYAATDKFLILALTPDYARELLTQLKEGKQTLAANPLFQDLTKRRFAAATSLTYCDLQSVYGSLYSLAHANASASDTNQLFRLNKLPSADTIVKHLPSPYESITVETERGTTTATVSSLGKPLTLLVGAVGAIGAAQPLLARLPLDLIPGMPTMSSGTGAHPRPAENQTAPSQTPATQ